MREKGSMANEPLEERIKKAKGYNPVWQPEPEEYIIGQYIGQREVKVKNGTAIALDLVNEKTQEEITTWGTQVLLDEFKKQEIQEGERIAIKYIGKVKNYHNWIVIPDRKKKKGE